MGIKYRDRCLGSWLPHLTYYNFELKVLVALYLYADYDSGETFVGQNTIAKLCGIDKRTVIRNIASLERRKAIKVNRRVGTSNYYTLLLNEQSVANVDKEVGHTGDTVVTPTVTVTSITNNNSNKLLKIKDNYIFHPEKSQDDESPALAGDQNTVNDLEKTKMEKHKKTKAEEFDELFGEYLSDN